MKEQIGEIDGTPNKRMYWSIISDYNLDTALAELIDNAIDSWVKLDRKEELVVEVFLNSDDQSIVIVDNAGGVSEANHEQLISPGLSSNNPNDLSIGVFGVGSKRAVVALAKNIRIQTRYQAGRTYQFDIDEQWFSDPSWSLPKFETDPIAQSSTRIELSRLRIPITAAVLRDLPLRLGRIYALFLLRGNFRLLVNRRIVCPKTFDSWAYPPEYGPIRVRGKIEDSEQTAVDYELNAGLVDSLSFKGGEDGVYFYCNGRLVAESVHDPEVGFVGGQAGVPHGEAALARVVCKLSGPAKSMPWNSFKTGINYHHKTFRALREELVDRMSYFASLSRRLSKEKESAVFKYAAGVIREISIADAESIHAVSLPPLPKVRKDWTEHLLASNRAKIREMPWTLGLIESIAAVDMISRRKNLQTKNRIALLLLDSAFEIALKEYLVHQKVADIKETDLQRYFRMGGRAEAWSKVKELLLPREVGPVVETTLEHFYRIRNKLVHQIATTEPTTNDVRSSRDAVERILALLFGIEFGEPNLDL